MISDKRAANAMGGKTARACDGCLLKRARWYCSDDDAFLCQGCDTSVHSANQLACRHTRVRLETSTSKFTASVTANQDDDAPAWYQGFTRKARTPRQNKSILEKGEGKLLNLNPIDPLVPDVGCEDESADENEEEQLICRVPVFDPFSAELSDMVYENGNLMVHGYQDERKCELDDGFIPSDLDLDQFPADVESLLGVELLDCKEEDESNFFHESRKMEVKEEKGIKAACCFDSDFDVTRASLDWSFGYESPTTVDHHEEEKVVPAAETPLTDGESKTEMKRNMLLSLNYESVITAWASQGSPWTSGSTPQFNLDDFMGSKNTKESTGGICRLGKRNITDGEREARVSRYREKRSRRLFSKKIRYQVRKLNAEKRPRIKGRFVKRASFIGRDCFSYCTS
ncbi:Complex I subunit NDUFS6 isoform 1 [Hibiscus syriacus]|uniref:Complex I subunit NDUFS6 isoform 1 n=1 Tax=Hibiscus syriacus TaxID=106335 RepID=A0A6A2Y8L7_HIBSY|nr:zinc finger protein CONSTANS-LIKE 16-like [Hibiscus syriacus]KAE8678325.1 Complex I subunit NDUFS6 isoform 1 [Hibiscus syriacus]